MSAIVTAAYFGVSLRRGSQGSTADLLSPGLAAGFNVVVVTLDTTRADHIGCYGYEGAATPTIDRLAAEGIRFADAVSPVPITLPAHASIFTGLDPPNHGVRHNGEYRLDASFTTLAELLQQRGYDTAAFIAAFVLDARFGLGQGFAHYDDRVDPLPGEQFGSLESQRDAQAVTNAALEWLRRRKSQSPFMLWVHYYDPHDPYLPPPPYADRFKEQPYDGEIAHMDAQLGRLVTALEGDGLADRTVMLVAGDHGESLGERHERTHSRLIYEATQHVPLIVSCPALIRGPMVVDDVVVSIADIFPTILELLGMTAEGPIDGVSLLRCHAPPDRMIYLETMATYLENGWAPLYGLRRHRDKYIQAPRPEYYDLAADPGERHNLLVGAAPDEIGAAAELMNALAVRMKDSPAAEVVAAGAMEVDSETLQRLQSLGYVAGRAPTPGGEPPDPKEMLPTWERLGEAKRLRMLGKPDDALATALEVLEQWPNDQSVLRELGMIYLDMGRPAEAEAAFRVYLEIDPDADICILMFEISARSRRIAEAETYLNQAVALDPDHGGVIVAQGDWMALHRRYDEARRFYEKAREVDPYRAAKLVDKRMAKIANRPG